MANVHEIITNKIIELIEKNNSVPWKRPWATASMCPMNLISRKKYTGINVFLLSAAGYDSPWWLSFKQIEKKGGTLPKGQKASMAIFWKVWEKEERAANGERVKKKIMLLRYYNVFNVLQTEGIKVPEVKTYEVSEVPNCENIGTQMEVPITIHHDSDRAYYSISTDAIHLPERKYFTSQEEYFSTRFHEMTHSTGAKNRLNRKGLAEGIAKFGSPVYSLEELCAEMGASFLCAETGIEMYTLTNSAAYISGWLSALKNDSNLIVKAAGLASKATNYIMGRKPETANEEDNND